MLFFPKFIIYHEVLIKAQISKKSHTMGVYSSRLANTPSMWGSIQGECLLEGGIQEFMVRAKVSKEGSSKRIAA